MALSMTIGISTSAGAYQLTGYRQWNSKIYYYYDNWIGTKAQYAFDSAAAAWRTKTTKATIEHCSANPNTGYDVYVLVDDQPNVAWDAKTSGPTIGTYYDGLMVTFNTAKPTWNDSGALKSAAVHELGHIFGLNENGTTKTIMNYKTYGENSRYETYRLTTPQTDDVNGVNAIY